MIIRQPSTAADFAAYYALRYQVLRQPWQQPPGSERADDDEVAATHHIMAVADDGMVIGVARLHPSEKNQVQVRAVAVHPDWHGRGVGLQLMTYLEETAAAQGFTECILHARESAVAFYRKLGYTVVAPSHTLFGVIPHFLMRKLLAS
ncbi:GCN5-related N-acetyltransferase [Hymenobacter roseosalivarius DSM 11622]|uniref:GCN5-related N-acetyltransferase n=1 Tax=Hymenobacter roseosalivarius DSM 11622 TaxID=645990 RepID=A0A1W1VQT6_9BACT|nr:GNAT family N-acetyltransferase [Hymenobacter roseosalivarius]SMB95633.1 GCN5-related N-acetyltransferase [Hymenobacter roseosalivarius DSM 11622]